MLIVLFFKKSHGEIYTQYISLHLLRNAFHFLGQYGWFIGLSMVPLAQVFALEFTVPIWTLCLACLFLNEKLTWHKFSAITFALIGVFLIAPIEFSVFGLSESKQASFIVLAAAIFYAISHTTTKVLSQQQSPLAILFWMCLMQSVFSLFALQGSWVNPDLLQWGFLFAIALSALSAHFCMIKALQLAPVSTVMSLDLLRLPVIMLVGYMLYNEQLSVQVLWGATIIVVANLWLCWPQVFLRFSQKLKIANIFS
jgi:drug/metabolite transporter (DMT)-like permease